MTDTNTNVQEETKAAAAPVVSTEAVVSAPAPEVKVEEKKVV